MGMVVSPIVSEVLDVPAGTTIVREGEEDTKVYVLLEGTCTVYKRGVEVTSFDQRGTLFGEISMILKCPRTATVKASTDVRLAVMDIDLDTVAMNYPDITKTMLHTLAKRVADQTEALFAYLATVDPKELGLGD